MDKLIKSCEYTAEQITTAFYNLYGSEIQTSNGFRDYTGFELLAMLEDWSRIEVLNYLA
jgi:hypothetical protein